MKNPLKIQIRQVIKLVEKQLKPTVKKKSVKQFLSDKDTKDLPPHFAYAKGRVDQTYDILSILYTIDRDINKKKK